MPHVLHPRHSATAIQQIEALRQSGVWYPDVSEPHLYLNTDTFPQRHHHVIGYRPLVWALFGASKGSYLRHLVAINAHFDFSSCSAIHFKYDNPSISDQVQAIGRHICNEEVPVTESRWNVSLMAQQASLSME